MVEVESSLYRVHGPDTQLQVAPGAAASTLLGQSSSFSAVSKGGYYGAPGPLPDLTQEMLRVEADIQLINSQIKHGPTGKGQTDGA